MLKARGGYWSLSSPEASTKNPTSGYVQWDSGSEWLCKHNRSRSEPIRFIRLDSEHAQSNGKSVNWGLLDVTWPEVVILHKKRGLWGRAWVLMAHKGRPCPKGILFSGFRNIKRVGISHLTLRYVKRQGNLSLKRISSQYCAVSAPLWDNVYKNIISLDRDKMRIDVIRLIRTTYLFFKVFQILFPTAS